MRILSDRRVQRLQKLKHILVQNTNEFCNNTTLHGIRYLNHKDLNSLERMFFGSSVILVLCCAAYFIFMVYDKWNRTPVIVGINPRPAFVNDEAFPAVTICNLNQALKSKASAIPVGTKEYDMLQYVCKRPLDLTKAHNNSTDWHDLEDFIEKISQPCERMIIACRFNGVECHNISDVFYPIINDEGLCCVFNMLHPKYMYLSRVPAALRNISLTSTSKAVNWNQEHGYPDQLPADYFPRRAPGIGETLGLSLVLNVEADEYYCTVSNSIGFKILYHSPNESPNIRETGVLIEPGKETKIRVRPEKSETDFKLRHMPIKYRRCLFQSEGNLEFFAQYTQRNCERECDADLLIQYCGCLSFYMPRPNDTYPICTYKQAECVDDIALGKIRSCLGDCFPSCYDVAFFADPFGIRLHLDSFNTANKRLNTFSDQYLQTNIAVVNTYFKEYSIRTTLKTEFIGQSDFLSNVGGLMGLFIGFSFISITEMFYFAIMRPLRAWFQKRHSSSRESLRSRTKSSKIPKTYFKRKFSVANGVVQTHIRTPRILSVGMTRPMNYQRDNIQFIN